MSIFHLEQEELLHTTVHIDSSIIPGICGVVFVRIRPGVSQVAVVAYVNDLIFAMTRRFAMRSCTHTSPDSGLTFANA